MSDLYGEIEPLEDWKNPDDYGPMGLTVLETIGNEKDNKAMGIIYENDVPKISLDVEQAIREMRYKATGGQILI